MFVRQIRQIGTVQKCLINLSKNVNEIKKEVSQTGQNVQKETSPIGQKEENYEKKSNRRKLENEYASK